MSDRRVSRFAGVALILVILTSELLKGDSPSPTGPSATVASYLDEHRTGILGGAFVQMLGLFLFAIVSLFVVERCVRERQLRAAALAALGAVLALVAYTQYVFLTAAAAFAAAGAEAGTARALWAVRFVAETFIAFPAALLLGSVAAAALRSTAFPRWYGWFSAAGAVAFLVGGGALAQSGAFAPDGDYGFLLFWLLPIWACVSGFVAAQPR
jgi:hypothetical protein